MMDIVAHAGRCAWGVALLACGGQDSVAPDASYPHDGFPPGFTLTSPVLPDGARVPDANTCAGRNGSPELAWTGAPAASQSFAAVLVNRSFNDEPHWVIYDVAAGTIGLPALVENAYAPASVPGAHQTTSNRPNVYGYLGPCTQFDDTYQFTVYALDVAMLPGMTAVTTLAEAITVIEAHKLGFAALLGTSSP
jgi:phosphatidylethanolamine-binding protein (PEBP) family uncharacterized protein